MQLFLPELPMVLFADLRYALRQLRNSLGFALLAIGVLALGIGISTAMCTVLRGVLFRPVPFPRPRALLTIVEPRGPLPMFWGVDPRDFRQWKATQHSFQQLAWRYGLGGVLQAPAGAQMVDREAVSANFFGTLGVRPMLGRDFTVNDEKQQTRTVILGYAVWHAAFHDDPSIVGRTVRLDKVAYQVIGVLPRGADFAAWGGIDVYTPPGWGPADQNLDVIGRLRPGVSMAQAQAELSAIQRHIAGTQDAKKNPAADRVLIRRWWDTVVGDVRPALLAFAAAVFLVWLVACANVASLQLTRNSARERELAVRSALGAARGRIVRQLLTESLLLSAIASVCGVALSIGLLRTIQHTLLRSLNSAGPDAFHIDAAVLAAIVALTFASTLLFGLLPAISAARSSAHQGLQARAATATRRQNRLRDILIAAELSVTVLLLVASGLLLRSLEELHHVPLGFRTDNILTTSMSIEPGRYDDGSVDASLFEPLMTRVRQLPGVDSVALSSTTPLNRSFTMTGMFDVAGHKAARPEDTPQGNLRFASPEFANTFGISIERGRFFRQGLDTPDSQPVVVVNHAFAARYLRGMDPLTAHLDMSKGSWSAVPIVGVLADTHDDSIAGEPAPALYLATTQLGPKESFNGLAARFAQLAVRTHTPLDLTASIHHVLHEVAPEIPQIDVRSMQQIVADSLGSETLAARLISLFAAATLLIAVVGLYGLIAYAIRQRRREIGVRMALGAQRSQVVALFLRRALTLVAYGLVIGLVASHFAARLLRSYLYGVDARDPLTQLAVSVVLLLCAGLAAWLPSHRAATIEPSEALRAE
ncbi:MAG TPA: ABC transporter permease [Acidobacteriaceae bacterium]